MKLILLLILLLASSASAKTLRVAVVDSGLDINDSRLNGHLCPTGSKDFTGEGLTDTVGHGTAMVGLIEQEAKDSDYCLVIYKYYTQTESAAMTLINEIKALQEATLNHISIVNLSGGGPIFDEKEYLTIRDNPGTLFVVAAGNEGQNLDTPNNEYYPASYWLKNELVIGNIGSDYKRSPRSNYGKKVSAVEMGENVKVLVPNGQTMMTGTSVSTAIFTGKLIKEALSAIQPIRK